MANNQYVNKVLFGDEVLIDLTQDTVNEGTILTGYTAHKSTGEQITGQIPIQNDGSSISENFTYNMLGIGFESGFYPTGVYTISQIKIQVPSSGTNKITISVPNGTTTPDPTVKTDWISLDFEVDSNGNSDIVDSVPIAETTSF